MWDAPRPSPPDLLNDGSRVGPVGHISVVGREAIPVAATSKRLAAKSKTRFQVFVIRRGALAQPAPSPDAAMHTYSEVLELAMMSARNARLASTKQAARELWKIAQEYQAEAARLGEMPDIGNPPQGVEG